MSAPLRSSMRVEVRLDELDRAHLSLAHRERHAARGPAEQLVHGPAKLPSLELALELGGRERSRRPPLGRPPVRELLEQLVHRRRRSRAGARAARSRRSGSRPRSCRCRARGSATTSRRRAGGRRSARAAAGRPRRARSSSRDAKSMPAARRQASPSSLGTVGDLVAARASGRDSASTALPRFIISLRYFQRITSASTRASRTSTRRSAAATARARFVRAARDSGRRRASR